MLGSRAQALFGMPFHLEQRSGMYFGPTLPASQMQRPGDPSLRGGRKIRRRLVPTNSGQTGIGSIANCFPGTVPGAGPGNHPSGSRPQSQENLETEAVFIGRLRVQVAVWITP